MNIVIGVGIGFVAWVMVRCVLAGFYTVDQNQRAVKTVFGRAQRMGNLTTLDDPIAESLRDDEKERYCYPAGPGDHAGRPVLQVAVGEGVQGLGRDRDGQHGL